MIWLLRLGLSGVGWLRDIAAGLLRWLADDFRHVAIALLLLASALLWWRLDGAENSRDDWIETAEKWQESSDAWQKAHRTLLADTQRARREALAADIANAQRVDAQYQVIVERTKNEYEASLADSATALLRLRNKLTAIANTGDGDSSPALLPEAYTARCRAYGAADCDALLTALPGQFAAAENNTEKLIALQDYVRSALLIDWGQPEAPTD